MELGLLVGKLRDSVLKLEKGREEKAIIQGKFLDVTKETGIFR